jgi:hypothetical protein
MSPAYYFHTTILHPPNSPPSPTFFQQTARPQQTNNQSINQLQQPMSHPDRQTDSPTITKSFFSPWVDLLASTQLPQQNSSNNLSQDSYPQPASRGSQNIPWPRLTMMKIAKHPTTWVLKHMMQEGGQIHKKRVKIVVTFTFMKLLCGGRIMLLHVAVWGGIVGQPNFISSLTLCCCHNNHNT